MALEINHMPSVCRNFRIEHEALRLFTSLVGFFSEFSSGHGKYDSDKVITTMMIRPLDDPI